MISTLQSEPQDELDAESCSIRPTALLTHTHVRRSRGSHLCRVSAAFSGGIALVIFVLYYASARSVVHTGNNVRTELAEQGRPTHAAFLSGAQARNELRNYWKSFESSSSNPSTGE
jgi:hypothetical protein